MMFRAWAAGRLPGYVPTLADLHALAIGLVDQPATVIHTYPVAMQVVRLVR